MKRIEESRKRHFYGEGLVGAREHWLPRTPGVQPEQTVEKAAALSWWKITNKTLELPDVNAQGCGKNQYRYEEVFINRLDCSKTILILASNTNLLFLTLWRLESLKSRCLPGVVTVKRFLFSFMNDIFSCVLTWEIDQQSLPILSFNYIIPIHKVFTFIPFTYLRSTVLYHPYYLTLSYNTSIHKHSGMEGLLM